MDVLFRQRPSMAPSNDGIYLVFWEVTFPCSKITLVRNRATLVPKRGHWLQVDSSLTALHQKLIAEANSAGVPLSQVS